MITSLNNGSYNGSIIYSADTQSYKAKPTGAEIGGIRNRLGGETAHRETSLQQLAQLIESGVTIQGAQLRSKQVSDENTDTRFLRQQLFAVDLDNVYKDKKTGQKRKLPDAYETPERILEISRGAGLTPCIIAESFSSTAELRKFHVLFASDKPVTDISQARQIILNLQDVFGSADEACKDPARILFGTTADKAVYVCNALNTAESLLTAHSAGSLTWDSIIDDKEDKAEKFLQSAFDRTEADPFRLLQMIDPNALSYEEWCRVTASYKLYDDADRSLWEAWNNQYSKVKPKADLRSYDGLTGKGVSKGTLKHFAKQHSPAEYDSYISTLQVRTTAKHDFSAPAPVTGPHCSSVPEVLQTKPKEQSAEWEPIKPFEREAEVQPFPMKSLPPILRDYLKAVADYTAVYPEMCVLPLLSVLSLCCQGKAVVKYPGNSHLEQLCLYTLTIAEPGERKSGCFQEFMRPLREYERRYNELHKAEIDDYNTHRAFLQQRINNELKGKNGSLEKAKEYRKELRELEEVQSMKLTLTDATPEALVRELHNHGEAIGIMGDEGTILSILGGVYSKGGVNYDIILNCYDGTYYTLSRQTSEDIILYCPLLTMGLMVQPGPFREAMTNANFSSKGLLQRFLFSFPKSMAGRIPFETPDVPKILKDGYSELITRLLRMSRPDKPPVLEVCHEAKLLFKDYHDMLQRSVQPGGIFENSKDYANKQLSKALRIAALLHLCEHDVSERISGQTAMNAINISLWTENQALRALDADVMSDTEKNARFVIGKLKKRNDTVFKQYDMLRMCRRLNGDTLTEALELLDEMNVISYCEEKQTKGRPIKIIRVNPAIKELKI